MRFPHFRIVRTGKRSMRNMIYNILYSCSKENVAFCKIDVKEIVKTAFKSPPQGGYLLAKWSFPRSLTSQTSTRYMKKYIGLWQNKTN